MSSLAHRGYTPRMSLAFLVAIFFLYSLIGWVIDTAVRSLDAKRFKSGNFLPLPLCPIYGVGVVSVLLLHDILPPLPILLEGLIYGILCATMELITGLVFLHVFHRRLWVYKGGILNIANFTDLLHVFIWSSLSLFMLYVLQPAIERLLQMM